MISTKQQRVMRKLLAYVLIIFLPIAIGVQFLARTPIAYQINHATISPVYQRYLIIDKLIHNLTGYFNYQSALSKHWHQHEKCHMAEVRKIFNGLLTITIIATLLGYRFMLFNALSVNDYLGLILSTSMLAGGLYLYFAKLWRWFHLVLFSNNDWIYHKGEVSYIMFPSKFFINATLFLFGFCEVVLVSCLVYQWFRGYFSRSKTISSSYEFST